MTRRLMMKYKIKHWKCFKSSFNDVAGCWVDKFDNDFLGVLLGNILAYLTLIVGLPVVFVMAIVWYIKRIKLIKKALPYDERAIRAMIGQGYVEELSKDQIHIIEEKTQLKKQGEKVLQDEKSKKLFNYGDVLYTVQGKSQVIKFVVDKITYHICKRSGGGKIGIREYWCNCCKHRLPHSNNFGSWRCRQNHNLFKNEQEAYAYLEKLKQGGK